MGMMEIIAKYMTDGQLTRRGSKAAGFEFTEFKSHRQKYNKNIGE
jgi:hypothetical protein